MSTSTDKPRDVYAIVRRLSPTTYRAVIEVGLCVTCAPTADDRLSMGARAERRAMEIAAELLEERAVGRG